ncbi:MAG TPA: LLM class flavin-dependent oxidoreductase [Stellaceae bacterium]|nr:LLM class flavin-dependent oxidoreductase [Stellaceae bacterium]
MKVYLWDLLPYGAQFDQYKPEKYLPYPLPRSHFDPEIAARTYEQHLEAWQEMDRLGFDGVGLNEHHTTPHGLMNGPNMMAAVGAQHTKNLKFLMLGNLLPIHNPLRVAEDIAMADCLSRGRVLAGFARGLQREYRAYNIPLSESRARFEEAFDVILKAWTEETMSHEGRFWKYKDVAIWPRPYQQPHPPLYVPFTGSRETIEWAAKHDLSAVIPAFHRGLTEDMVTLFARATERHGRRLTPDRMIYFGDAYVAASADDAIREYSPWFLYFNQILWHHGSIAAPGAPPEPPPPPSTSYDYVRPENRPFAEMDREKIRQITFADVEKRVHGGQLSWGPAKEVADALIAAAEHAGCNAVLLNTCNGVVPHELFMEQIRRVGRELLPRLHAHQVTRVPYA